MIRLASTQRKDGTPARPGFSHLVSPVAPSSPASGPLTAWRRGEGRQTRESLDAMARIHRRQTKRWGL